MALQFAWIGTKAKILMLLAISLICYQLLLVSFATMKTGTLIRLPADTHGEQPMDSVGKSIHQFSTTSRQDKYGQHNNANSPNAKHKHRFDNTASGSASEYHLNDTNIRCSKGYFQLNNDGICHPWLACADIQNNVTAIKRIGGGWVKRAYLARWKEYTIVLLNRTETSTKYRGWFERGARTMQQFQPSPFVTQLIGYCPSIPAIITEYHRFGSLKNINKILKEHHKDNIATRFRLSLDYVKIINFLHTNPNGTYVMCDSSALSKILEQYLLTSDFHIVLNDLDKLPVVNPSVRLNSCGFNNTFAAPEQRLPSSLRGKDDEKSDIWKIPPVVDYLLADSFDGDVVKSHLSKLHQQCRSTDPKSRPTANEILHGYLDVQQTLHL